MPLMFVIIVPAKFPAAQAAPAPIHRMSSSIKRLSGSSKVR
jgi:hypothetical protein